MTDVRSHRGGRQELTWRDGWEEHEKCIVLSSFCCMLYENDENDVICNKKQLAVGMLFAVLKGQSQLSISLELR